MLTILLLSMLFCSSTPKKPLEKMTVTIGTDTEFEIDWPLFWRSVNDNLSSPKLWIASAIMVIVLAFTAVTTQV